MTKYSIIYEKDVDGYCAYVPDLPGCVATAKTIQEASIQIQAAITFHLEGLQLEGLPIPEPTTICEYIEAA